jgi:prepilin-type processing-associated H-X9-DG protein
MYVGDFRRYAYHREILKLGEDPNVKESYFWFGYLHPYTGAHWWDGLYRCPTYTRGYGYMGGPAGGFGSYAYSTAQAYSPRSLPLGQIFDHNAPQSATAENAVRNPADIYAIGDSRSVAGGALYPFGAQDAPYGPDTFHPNRFTADYGEEWITEPHPGGRNIVFCDGHIEAVNRRYLFEKSDYWSRRWYTDNQPHPEQWSSYPIQ